MKKSYDDMRDEVNAAVAKMAKELTGEDELGAVVRIHLRIETELTRLVERSVRFPNKIPRSIGYENKLKWSLAFGLPAPLSSGLKRLGEIRNKFAHRQDYALDDEIVNDFYGHLDQSLKDETQSLFQRFQNGPENRLDVSSFSDLSHRDRFTTIATALFYCTVMSVRTVLGEAEVRDLPLTRALGLFPKKDC